MRDRTVVCEVEFTSDFWVARRPFSLTVFVCFVTRAGRWGSLAVSRMIPLDRRRHIMRHISIRKFTSTRRVMVGQMYTGID